MIKFKIFSGALILSCMVFIGCQNNPSESDDTETIDTTSGGNEGEGAARMEQSSPQPLDEVSEEDLQKFSEAVTAVQQYGQQVQPRMLAVVQEAGLDPQRFSEIMQAQQMQDTSLEITPEEQVQFEEAQTKINAIQADATEVMEEKIEEAGLTIDHYEAILATVRQDPQLQQKLSEMQSEQMGVTPQTSGS